MTVNYLKKTLNVTLCTKQANSLYMVWGTGEGATGLIQQFLA
jgi:hypothetical protein